MEKTGNHTTFLFALTTAVGCALLFSSCETTSTANNSRKTPSSHSNRKAVTKAAKADDEQKADIPIVKDKEGKLVAIPIMLRGVEESQTEPRLVEPKRLPKSNSQIVLASAGTFNTPSNSPAFSSTLRPSSAPAGGMMMVRTTAYCHKEADHIAYGNKSAAGGALKYGGLVRSAAADWSKYPMGTRFRITGLPYEFVVDDYGSALVGTGTIDIYQPSFAAMNAWGVRNVPIQVIQWGSYETSRRILASRAHVRHAGHVRIMLREIERRATTSASVGSSNPGTSGEA